MRRLVARVGIIRTVPVQWLCDKGFEINGSEFPRQPFGQGGNVARGYPIAHPCVERGMLKVVRLIIAESWEA